MHIAADVWLAKQEAVPILLMYYFTLKLLIEYKESWLAEISNELGFCQLTKKTYRLLKFKMSTSGLPLN